jgi:Kef-type K+ transport system membrane component KefB
MDNQTVGLIAFFLVLTLPKLLERLFIPAGISALGLGVLSYIFFPFFREDEVLKFLSVAGITSLFLFSGLEIKVEDLKSDKKALIKYVVVFLLILFVVSSSLYLFLDFNIQESVIYSLGLVTPSSGFIISSLSFFKMDKDQEDWVKPRAIVKEVVSIFLLFIILQIDKPQELLISTAILAFFFFMIPFLFRLHLKFIAAHTENSGVPFLVAISIVAGVVSKNLGAYYIVGAFIVGVVGSQFLKLVTEKVEKDLFKSLSSFTSVFLPFYFFHSGVKLSVSGFTMNSVAIGFALLVFFIPLRLFIEKYALSNKLEFSILKKLPLSLIPTLVFGLVIVGVLIEKNLLNDSYIYGLVIYTTVCSAFPLLLYKTQKKNLSLNHK